MNLFYVPSWYPDPEGRRHDGIFFQEMVRALARHHPDLRIWTALWGQTERNLSTAQLRFLLHHPTSAFPTRPARAEVLPNLVELNRPTWSWRYRTQRGNIDSVLRASRWSFAQARAEGGAIDLIHAQVSFPAGYLAQRLSDESGVPYMISEHMGDFPFPHFVRRGKVVPDVAEPLRHARRVTAVSRFLAHEIHEKTGVEAMVIPNGVDETFFSPGPMTPRNGCSFLTVAALEPHKGIADLLRAIAGLGPRPGVRFRIAGAGSLAARYRADAASLGIADRVEWLGPLRRAEVRDAMRSCDAFVLPSRYESFGLVLAEAIACGKPVVSTKCGGPEDIVGDVNGLLVPVGDAAAIAGALATMADRASGYDAAAIRADFEARFSSRLVSQRYATLYRDLVGSG